MTFAIRNNGSLHSICASATSYNDIMPHILTPCNDLEIRYCMYLLEICAGSYSSLISNLRTLQNQEGTPQTGRLRTTPIPFILTLVIANISEFDVETPLESRRSPIGNCGT